MSLASIGPEPAVDHVAPEEPGIEQLHPALRLVPTHDHEWRLRDIEYDDRGQVRRFECDDCGDVTFG